MANENKQTLFNGFKNSEICYYSNAVYYVYMLMLEAAETVEKYYQPRLDILLDNKKGDPDWMKIDFWVTSRDGVSQFVHIHEEETLDPVALCKGIEYAMAVRSEFKAISEKEILREPRRSNLEKLWRQTRRSVQNIHAALLNTFFKEVKNPTVLDLGSFLTLHGFSPDLVDTLIFRKAVLADLDNFPVTEQTALLPNPRWINVPPAAAHDQYALFEFWQGFDPEDKAIENF